MTQPELVNREVTSDGQPPAAQAKMLGGLAGENVLQAEMIGERLDDFDEIRDLEREHQALRYIRGKYALKGMTPMERALAPLVSPMRSVEQIGNQFAKKILPAYMNDNPEEGLELFRQIKPHTTQEEMVLLVHDDQFLNIQAGVKRHLAKKSEEIDQEVSERLDPKAGQIGINDRLQFKGVETASSLENILHRGVEMSLESDAIEALSEIVANANGSIPITEQVKNLRLITIGRFRGSKISHTVHDAMDHAWTFDLLKKKGFLDDYAELFRSIGDPHRTNIFFREGEAVASIAFGARYWSITEQGFKPVMRCADLAEQMNNHFDEGKLTEGRHLRAYRIIRELAKEPNSREAQSLGFDFSNYFTELDEQRRKHGKIKQKDLNTGMISGELDPLSPDFLSLFIETHHELMSSKNKHRNDLFVFHIMLEEFLRDVGTGALPQDAKLNVRVQDLRTRDVTQTTLPPERLHWMFRNYGFTSTKDSIY